MRFKWVSALAILAVCFAAMVAFAQVPLTISYQGRLADGSGNPVPNGSYNLNFTIWNDPTLNGISNQKWVSGSVAITTSGGLFNVNLGAPGQNILPESLFVNDTALWLGISVNGGAELVPRTKLTSVAFAYVAGTLPNNSLYSTKIVDEAGLTNSAMTGGININYSVTLQDMAVVSITTPSGGFVMINATGQVGMSGPAGLANHVSYQIDQTAGGNDEFYFYYWVGQDNTPNTGYFYTTIAASRFYYVPFAGTYQFRLEARSVNSGNNNYCWSPVITATYFPTYYGLLAEANSATSAGGRIDTAYVEGAVPAKSQLTPMPQPNQKTLTK